MKGRSKELIEMRNAALLRRFRHLTEKEHLRFDYVLKKLSEEEFFLSEERIMAILRTSPLTPPHKGGEKGLKING